MESNNLERINDNTTMIDMEMLGLKRIGAVYLVQAGLKCLIDSGTKKEAKNIVRALDSVGAFPPDILVLTHSHWDHTQGTPLLCREADKRGKKIKVMASEKAIPNLQDQSWNSVFDEKQKFENIKQAEPLKDGETIDLDGLELKIFDFAGHCADDIALYDQKNKVVFVADSIGYKVENVLSFPAFMPPFWDETGFYSALEKLKQIDYQKLCLAHFGCLKDDAAKKFPEEAAKTHKAWWNVFAEAESSGKLDDLDYMKQELFEKTNVILPDLEVSKASMRMVLSAINTAKKILGKKPIQVAEVQMEGVIDWLTKGYKASTKGA